jgi:phosphoinositide-3-kinase regulatory subunit 4
LCQWCPFLKLPLPLCIFVAVPFLQDIFSLGCVLAELFLDGQPLFDYSRLLAYRLGGAAAAGSLAALDKVHPSVRGMVAHMLQRDPAKRYSVEQYLQA